MPIPNSRTRSSADVPASLPAHSPLCDAAAVLPSYASDTSGVCSALYELSGMTVVHDASGCNSTYSTFDEPRWYDRESLIYISGLTEMDAITGNNEEKLIRDCLEAVKNLSPRFLTLCTSPMPVLLGTDMEGIKDMLAAALSIPVFTVRTNGINSYLVGASKAWSHIVPYFCGRQERTRKKSVNILGATPLDIDGKTLSSLKAWLGDLGYEVPCTLAYNTCLEDVERIPSAWVNLVISSSALDLAHELWNLFHQPYVVGLPVGGFKEELRKRLTQEECFDLHMSVQTDWPTDRPIDCPNDHPMARPPRYGSAQPACLVIGEPVRAVSLAQALDMNGIPAAVYSPLEDPHGLVVRGKSGTENEDMAATMMESADIIIADPFYAVLAGGDKRFIQDPHTAFSGRVYADSHLNLLEISTEELLAKARTVTR